LRPGALIAPGPGRRRTAAVHVAVLPISAVVAFHKLLVGTPLHLRWVVRRCRHGGSEIGNEAKRFTARGQSQDRVLWDFAYPLKCLNHYVPRSGQGIQ
jgi:hypothetical protein